MMIFLIVLFHIIMFLTGPAMQWDLLEIEPDFFKKIKIKKLTFLFRPIGGKDSIYGNVKEYGVIFPMFMVQLLGYVVALISGVLTPILYFVANFPLTTIVIAIGSVLGAELLVIVGITIACMIISKRKEK